MGMVFKNSMKVFVLYFLFGFLIYHNSFNNQFLIDDFVFAKNPIFSGYKFALSQWDPYLQQAWGVMDSHMDPGYYRPLAHIVYDLMFPAFKEHYWQYHLLNLLAFAFSSSLIFAFILRLSGNLNLAFLTGLLYLIHPVNGIIVNYVTANVFAFQVICMLGTMFFLLSSLDKSMDRGLYAMSLVFMFLSMFWHESGILTPVYVSAVVFLFRKDPVKAKALCLLPYFLIGLAYLVFRAVFSSFQFNAIRDISHYHMSLGQYAAALFHVLSWYIGQLFYPVGVVMVWATPIMHDHTFWPALGLVLLVISFFALLFKYAREPVNLLAVIWIMIGFVPVFLSAFLVQDENVRIEPHWFVFSSIGFFVLAAHVCLWVLNKSKWIGSLFLLVLLLAWGSISHANNLLWANQKTYSLYWAQQAPAIKATYYYIAAAYRSEGDLKNAYKYYKLGMTESSTDIGIVDLGVLAQAQGRLEEAKSYYLRAVKYYPQASSILNNLGSVYYAEGDLTKAEEFYQQALILNPLLLQARRGLAAVYIRKAMYPQAMALCLKNLDILNDDPKTLLVLINLTMLQRNFSSLTDYAHRFIHQESDPKNLTDLGTYLAIHHLDGLALDCFAKIMQTDPGNKDAYWLSGNILANSGRYAQAIRIWRIGEAIAPTDLRFSQNIHKAQALESK